MKYKISKIAKKTIVNIYVNNNLTQIVSKC